ncbi:MAG: MFS transporter [Isosphaeraceae bacterium]|nr:MAG: MFS transporter [Isosphaeraceae bacterium]
MNASVIARLLIMMFLQYFVWGIWLPILPLKLSDIGLSANQTALIMTTYGFGSILGPFVLGQLADRYFAAERVVSLAHIIGGLLLIVASGMSQFWPLFLLMFLYCNLYMPTMGLTNAIAFKGLGEGNEKYFAWIRNMGAVGWIVAGLFFAWYLNTFKPTLALEPLRFAGWVSIAYGVYCLFLPHTPPTRVTQAVEASGDLAERASDLSPLKPPVKRSAVAESLELLNNRSFAVLVATAGLIGIMLAFYFGAESLFLKHIGVAENDIGGWMTLGQIVEMIVTLFVPLAITQLGFKTTMIIGAAFWAARFGISILGQPTWLMLATITFHGFCFGFFFVVAFIFVDKAAPADIRSTAQNLLVFVVYGVGTVIGNLIVGPLRTAFGDNWAAIWAGPFVLTTLALLAFAALFRPDEIGETRELSAAVHA